LAKAPDAFRTISEVAEQLETPAHVLRFWESKFAQVKPVKRAGGRRYYRPDDMALLGGIKVLLHDQGMTIKGAQKILREQGIKSVMSLAIYLQDADATDTVDAVAEPVPESPLLPDQDTTAVHHTPDTMPGPQAEPEPDTQNDNIVTLPRATHTVTTEPVQADLLPAASEVTTRKHVPDLPPDPAPRPITGPRLLGELAMTDRGTLMAQAQSLRPIVDRLRQAHTRMTAR